jgi:hypothetical protein
MDPILKAQCSNDLENFPTTCPLLTPTRKPHVLETLVLSLLIFLSSPRLVTEVL